MNWQVSWQKKIYDYQKVVDDYRNGRHTGFIKQSKGLAKMQAEPQIGDNVYISCNKLKIMKCKVMSGFVENEQEMRDDYHIGPHRPTHTRNNILLALQIVEVYDEPERMLGFQRTWVKLRLDRL